MVGTSARRGRGVRRRAVAVALVVPVLAAAALAGPAQAGPAAAGDAPAPRAAAAVPALEWGPCPEDPEPAPPGTPGSVECAEALVPLDHDEPDGPTTTVALARRLADDPATRIGSLFVDPGGPGGSGVDFLLFGVAGLYSPDLLARFDVVGFDPRGVARSAPLVCFASFDDFFEFSRFLPTFPVWPAQEAAVAEAAAGYTDRCATRGGAVLEHMSTADVARDLDLLREAVGDAGLSYAGYSYGTQLGTTYANLFPDRVRALVLDGVLDPVAWTTGVTAPRPGSPSDLARRSGLPVSARLGSAESAHVTLQEFFRLCREAGPERCALAEGDPQRRFARLADRLLAEPVELPFGGGLFQRVGYAELVALALGALYEPAVWPDFADAVAEVEEFGDRDAAARALLDVTARLGLDHEESAFQTVEGDDGVVCSDSANPDRASAWRRASGETDRRAPYFGRAWTWLSIACATWPAAATEDRYAGPWDARTAAPVLLIGTRHDPATPYAGAQTVADLLPGSRLLTHEGWGHLALGRSACAAAAVEAYLVDGVLPPPGATCPSDVAPFAPPEEVDARQADALAAGRAEAREHVLRVNLPYTDVLRRTASAG